ncbi:MAG TPA: glycoside hydrolase family 20 zincin-like fold domain-containing protein [Terracidiphilus sp.]|nr:glycoside hydrolase family 20 zincin-like fold domain-containing protein [Terracidiphilus sp.]
MPRICRSAFYLLLLASPLLSSSFAVAQAQVHLLPAPREARFGATVDLPARIIVSVPVHNAEDEFAAHDLEDAIQQMQPAEHQEGKRAASAQLPYRVLLLRRDSVSAKALLDRQKLSFDPAMESEGYVLIIEPHSTAIIGASGSGVFYGVQTFKQLLPLPGASRVLPSGTVRDWPAMRYRGIDDDLSRGPFPTLEFQKHQIRVFASFKINIYSPYFEHTLLYSDHPLAAPPGSALTPSEAAELVAYARQYHVTIVPEQEAFGHLHHVLKYELYQDEAETPYGHVLAPGQPATLPLIKDWFTQIAQEFPSPFIHIGADETWDLGIGRTQDQVQAQGYGPVYMAFLKQIHDELAPLNRRLLFWGDIGDENPDAVPNLPKDMIAVPWNYSANTDFDKLIEPFAKAGMETWVAPGDSNWNEVFPMAQNALWNIQRFIREGQRLGSTGALTTVWNDDGEGLFNMDWYSLLFGAVAAWQPGESSIADYQDAYGPVFHLDPTGNINTAEKELMAAEEALINAKTGLNSDNLFWLDPWSSQGQVVSAQLLPFVVDLRIHAERAIVAIAQARQSDPNLREPAALTAMDLGARRLDLIGMKFEIAQSIASSYAQAVAQQHDKSKSRVTGHLLEEISSNNGRCQDLRDAYSAIKGEYSQVWLGENRPYWLNNVTVRYDLEIEKWQRRANQFQQGTRDWRNGKDLPAPASLEMPDTNVH